MRYNIPIKIKDGRHDVFDKKAHGKCDAALTDNKKIQDGNACPLGINAEGKVYLGV